MKIVLKKSVPCFQYTIPADVELNYFITKNSNGMEMIYAKFPQDEKMCARITRKNIRNFKRLKNEILNPHHPDCPAVDGFGCRCYGTFLKQMK